MIARSGAEFCFLLGIIIHTVHAFFSEFERIGGLCDPGLLILDLPQPRMIQCLIDKFHPIQPHPLRV
jgi:hypothetical protein